jgi:hypothetical protein
MLGAALALLAEGAIKAAARVAPQRELDVFPHRLWGRGRPWWHLAFDRSPGSVSIDIGGWTVDVSWKRREVASA